MERSILKTIRKMIGPSISYDVFDLDLIVHINSAFMTLFQLGVGPKTCFHIEGDTETWDDFFGDKENLEAVISYVYMKVRLAFDPPSTGPLIESYRKMIQELEWRLNVMVDPEEVMEPIYPPNSPS